MSKNRKIQGTSGNSADRRREVLGIVGLGAAMFLLVAMISLQAGKLIMGPFGKSSAGLFYGLAGVCGYALIALGLIAAIRTLLERDPVMPGAITLGTVIGVFSLATIAHLAAGEYRVAGHGPGGAIGEHTAEILRAVISTAGTALLAFVGVVVAVVVATPLRMRDVLRAIGHGAAVVGGTILSGVFAFGRFWRDVFRAILPQREFDDPDYDEVIEEDVLEVAAEEETDGPVIIEKPARKKKTPQGTEIDLAPPGPGIEVKEELEAKPTKADKKRTRFPAGTQAPDPDDDEPIVLPVKVDPAKAAPPVPADGPMIVESKFKNVDKAAMAAKEKAVEAERQTFIKLGEGDYKLPSIQLLNYDASTQNQIDRSAMLEQSAKLT
ncbi:MAG: DNA translocase FtsK 4TM domain-containing protein, partial [Deltaproteobacteria bacterium]|nr:DNA translocase FtsK 4TM domain-containing protein [Deltaproteobacteria bacterium]